MVLRKLDKRAIRQLGTIEIVQVSPTAAWADSIKSAIIGYCESALLDCVGYNEYLIYRVNSIIYATYMPTALKSYLMR